MSGVGPAPRQLPGGWRLRRASPADAAALAALAREAYAPWVPVIGREPGPMLDDYPTRIAADLVWLAEDGEGVAALLVLIEKPDGILLDNVAVAARTRGRGLGRALVAFAESEARRLGHARLGLYTHALMSENVDMYRRLGYAQTRRVTEHGFDRIYLRKRL